MIIFLRLFVASDSRIRRSFTQLVALHKEKDEREKKSRREEKEDERREPLISKVARGGH